MLSECVIWKVKVFDLYYNPGEFYSLVVKYDALYVIMRGVKGYFRDA